MCEYSNFILYLTVSKKILSFKRTARIPSIRLTEQTFCHMRAEVFSPKERRCVGGRRSVFFQNRFIFCIISMIELIISTRLRMIFEMRKMIFNILVNSF
ncbi:hypothetical protein DPV73_01165 [Leptospira mayottensis]|nr:hypothetical protein DPV73_01085 [Leptospira mayottensis]AXR66844.1 hypothetical protein DPV73_01165 [Leptospira mayottensis]